MTHETATATPRSPFLRPVPLVGAVVLLAVGLSVGAWLGIDSRPATVAAPEVRAPGAVPAVQVSDAPPPPTGTATTGPGADPAGAVDGYLTAEATSDLATAYTYLVPEEQAAFGTSAAYVAEHADLLGTVTGFTISEVTRSAEDVSIATVAATVGFEPTLDPVIGLVPATATVTFPVAESADGWGVSLAGATFEPLIPGDDRAAADARDYVAAAVACTVPAGAYGGELVGQPAFVTALCDATGDATVTDVAPLDDPLTVQPFLSAFGPDVTTWARVVTVSSPEPLRLVLAPYGDVWTVVGALPPQT